MANPFEQFEQSPPVEQVNPFAQFEESAPTPETPQQEEPGFLKQVGEFFTGNDRQTRATEELPELASSGLLSGSDMLTGVKVVPAILTATTPEEIAQILTTNYPEIGIQYDPKGNILAANNKTGQRAVINQPGASGQDFLNILGLGSLYATGGGVAQVGKLGAAKLATKFPSIAGSVGQVAGKVTQPIKELATKYSRTAGLAKGAAISGAETTGVEAYQEAAGGEFDLENVLIDMFGGSLTEYIPAVLRANKASATKKSETLTREAVEAEAARAGSPLSPEVQGAQQTELLTDLVSASRDPNKLDTLRELPSDIAQDPKIKKAADDLNIGDIPPSWASTNDQYIEIEQGLTSVIGSDLSKIQKEKIKSVNQKADDIITDFGGTKDMAALSDKIKTDILGTIDGLSNQADDIYKEINRAIPANTAVDMTSIREGILEKAATYHPTDIDEGIKKLGKLETELLALSEGSPTYALIDRERKAIGEAQRKGSGPYQNEAEGNLKYLYGLISNDQEQAAKGVSQEAADLWSTAKGMVLKRKDIEEQSIFLLGKNKSAAIMPKLGAATKKIQSGDYKAFDEIMDNLPAHLRGEAVLSSLNDAFVSSGKREKQLSFNDFNKWMEGLDRNRAAKIRIMKHLPPQARTRLKTLNTLTKGIERATRERVTTGRLDTLLKPFEQDGMIEKIYGTTKKVVDAIPGGAAVTGKLGIIADVISRDQTPLIQAADKLLSSPKFQNALENHAQTGIRSEAKRAAALKALERSDTYKKWVDKLPGKEQQALIKAGVMTYLTGEEF